MLDPTLHIGLLKALQKTINTSLRYDPGTQAQLQTLNAKQLHIICSRPAWQCFVQFDAGEIILLGQSEQVSDCEIQASASALLAYLQEPGPTLAKSGVKVSGDVALLNHLQKIIKQVEIDWEAALNSALGDTGGHLVANVIRRQSDWLKDSSTHVAQWLPQYLSEELRLTPHRLELEDFYQQVQELNSATARLEKRLNKARQARNAGTASSPPQHAPRKPTLD